MSEADDASQLAEDVRSALDEYASVYREAVRIAADGAPGDEVADLASRLLGRCRRAAARRGR